MKNQLYSIGPIDGRYSQKLSSLGEYLSEYGLIKARLYVEVEYLVALEKCGLLKIAKKDKARLISVSNGFNIKSAEEVKKIEQKVKHDVKAIEYYLRKKLPAHMHKWIHFGLTSEDVTNLAYSINIQKVVNSNILPLLHEVSAALEDMVKKHASTPMLARTHGQPAVPTTFGKEIAVYLWRIRKMIASVESHTLTGKLNGAVGNYNALFLAFPDIDWMNFSEEFIKSLGLSPNLITTQIESHDSLSELFDMLRRVNTLLTGLAKDMWLYIALELIVQIPNKNEVGSSTMPQKINPIHFENAEGNFGVANGLFIHFSEKLAQSRMQRDLSDSTVQRNIGVALAHSIIAYQSLLEGLSRCRPNANQMARELDAHPEVMSEAVQTLMRLEGIPEAYEKTKMFIRGKDFDKESYRKWLLASGLSSRSVSILITLTPSKYIGLAEELARKSLVKK